MIPSALRRFLFSALLIPALALSAAAVQKAAYNHYLKALLLSNQGNSGEALKEYEAALKLDSGSAFMYEQAAELALEMGQSDRAMEYAQRLVELSPQDGKAFFLLGNVHWARGELEPAQAAFEKTLELQPDYAHALYTLGNLLSSQSPELAKRYLQDYVAQNPDNASDAEFQIAVIEQRAGREDGAVEHLRSAIELDQENMHAYYALAQIYEVRRDTVAALAVYEEILERDPGNAALLNHVGEIHYLVEDIEAARGLFQRAKDLQPANPTTCLWLALLAEQQDDYKAAAEHIRASSALDQEASLNLRLSYYLTQADDLKSAVAVLENAHKSWPRNEEISYFLALGYDDLKLPRRAIELMKEVLALRADHRDARFQLGALYEKTGDIANTEIQFREILRAHPDDDSALNFLGYTLADRNMKLDDAEAMIARAVELNPRNGAYIDSLGWVHYRRGRLEEALRELRRAATMLPADDAVWAHLGEVLDKRGLRRESWQAWKRSQLYAPQKAQYEVAVAKLEKTLAPEELGAYYQEFLGRMLEALTSYGGPCAIRGEVAGKKFTLQGIVHYKAPWDLTVDVLGPMFVPVLGIAVRGEDGFEMDPLDLEGVRQELLREKIYGAVMLLRDFFAGGIFRSEPAVFKRGWRRSRLVTPAGTLHLNKSRTRIASIQAPDQRNLRLYLSGYQRVQGRWLPAHFKIMGKGFVLEFGLQNPNAVFEPASAAPTRAD